MSVHILCNVSQKVTKFNQVSFVIVASGHKDLFTKTETTETETKSAEGVEGDIYCKILMNAHLTNYSARELAEYSDHQLLCQFQGIKPKSP